MTSKALTIQAKAEVQIQVPRELTLTILEALRPEAETPSSERSSARVRGGDGEIVITAEASDTTALRASLNSYLRWVQGILDMFSKL
ncbi:hypothetical protein JXL21_03615 [Candidatus Bathyarchaeota archaeon]|nr:hypothetical protein [Candidatus Bathyarchaeota archaeon]